MIKNQNVEIKSLQTQKK